MSHLTGRGSGQQRLRGPNIRLAEYERTTMDPGSLEKAAAALLEAYAGTPIEPPTKTYPEMTVADAYDVQRAQVGRWVSDGAVIKGHKVGLTSAAMQRQLGVDQPDYGHLLGSMFHADNAPIDAGRFLQPRIEPEVAFVLDRPLAGPGVTAADAVRAVDCV